MLTWLCGEERWGCEGFGEALGSKRFGRGYVDSSEDSRVEGQSLCQKNLLPQLESRSNGQYTIGVRAKRVLSSLRVSAMDAQTMCLDFELAAKLIPLCHCHTADGAG